MMPPRFSDSPRGYRRRLHFEHLESKVAPGVLLWGAGLLGEGVAEPLAQTHDQLSLDRPQRAPATQDDGVARTRGITATARDDAPFDWLAAQSLNERAARGAMTEQPFVSPRSLNNNQFGAVVASPTSPWAPSVNAPNPSIEPFAETQSPLLKSPRLFDTPPGPSSGGGSRAGGGSAPSDGPASATASGATGSASAVGQAVPDTASAVAQAVPDNSPASNRQAQPDLLLVDATGQPLNIAPDANTPNPNILVIAAATWCGASALLKRELLAPGVMNHLGGLRLVFAFTDEGGSGPGGVENPEFLADLPGEVAFLPRTSVQPSRFPMTFSSVTSQFDRSPYEAINAWAAADNPAQPPNLFSDIAKPNGCSRVATGGSPVATISENVTAEPAVTTEIIAQGASVSFIPGDYNDSFRVDAADYTLWRDTLGQTGPGLAADGSGNNIVDQADYEHWQAHFGEMGSAPGAFTITGPLGIQVAGNNVVTWTASPGATSYHFVLSQQADLSFPGYDEIVTTNSNPVHLNGSAPLYIGVTAINSVGSTVADNQGFHTAVYLQPDDQLIFVTSTEFAVSDMNTYPPLSTAFGSALAADYHCTALASAAGLLEEPWDSETLHFKAMVTQSSIGLVDRVSLTNDTYFNTEGHIVAPTLTVLLSGNWSAPVLDQHGETLLGEQLVWTGATSGGGAGPSKCSNWSDPTFGSTNVGNLNGVGTDKISADLLSCQSQARLYCVGRVAVELNLLKDVNPFSAPSDAADFTVAGGLTYFTATDGAHGRELWVTDGVLGGAGTRMVKDINPGSGSGTREIYGFSMAYVGGELFFTATTADHLVPELWKTDGTEEGTVQVNQTSIGLLPVQLTGVGDTLFFAARDETGSRQQLWKSDGTDAGTVIVEHFTHNLNVDAAFQNLTAVGNTLYFTFDDSDIQDGDHGRELWKSDGTEAGTEMVIDLIDGAESSTPELLTNVDGTLYFVAGVAAGNPQLWKTGGTLATTEVVHQFYAYHPSQYLAFYSFTSLTNVDGTLFFFDGPFGRELWKANSTTGAMLVAEIFPLGSGLQHTEVAAAGGLFYFQHITQETGLELWKSDGTLAGTTIVKDIAPESVELGHSYPTHLTNIGGTLYFSANDHVNGYELWRTDGTALGTRRVAHLAAGPVSSDPIPYAGAGGLIYVTATGDNTGREIWVGIAR